jgi:hypothetical protein
LRPLGWGKNLVRALDEPGDAVEHPRARLVPPQPEQAEDTGVRPHEPEQHSQARRLAGAVRPEHAVHLAQRDLDGVPVHGGQLAVALAHADGLDREHVADRAHTVGPLPEAIVKHKRRMSWRSCPSAS